MRRIVFAILYDLTVIPVAWLLAFGLRFNWIDCPFALACTTLPYVFVIQTAAFVGFGLYRGIWRFASVPDLIRILKATWVGMAGILGALYLTHQVNLLPRSIPLLYGMLLLLALGGARFTVRWMKDYKRWIQTATRVLVVGLGPSGESLVRELLRDKARTFIPVALIDPKQLRVGRELQGIRVWGGVEDIPWIVKHLRVQLIMLAVSDAKAPEMQAIIETCEQTALPVRTLPQLQDLVAGRVSIDLLRELSLEDLLGRHPVALDWDIIGQHLNGKRILVSGAGGSIGSELCRQIARLLPELLIVCDHSEFHLFSLQQELLEQFPHLPFQIFLMDVRDRAAVKRIMQANRPDIVFHAAAYKHVPMLQTQVREAAYNNIIGTLVMAQMALLTGIRQFVLVSTDKAVHPTNIMGASKRIAEMICQYYNCQRQTRYNIVRFGNVLGSAGSVVPLFRKQLAQGGPLKVTHPEITRFFMTIPEAAQLIMQAASMPLGGEIFVLDMGEPIKIRILAEHMIRLAGKRVGEDIQIEYTGLRPGEKLYEELFHPDETLLETTHPKIFQAEFTQVHLQDLEHHLAEIEYACQRYDEKRLRQLIAALVPELQGQALAGEALLHC